jgi:hypothetical protein
VVEHHLAKVRVAGSNPVVRSKKSAGQDRFPVSGDAPVGHSALPRVVHRRYDAAGACQSGARLPLRPVPGIECCYGLGGRDDCVTSATSLVPVALIQTATSARSVRALLDLYVQKAILRAVRLAPRAAGVGPGLDLMARSLAS